MVGAVLEVRLRWNVPQSEFMRSTEPYVDLEGAVRAGKTTPLIWKVVTLCWEHPGMQAMLSRWTQDGLDAQLKPRFYELVPRELLGAWHADEEYRELRNGSRIYLRSLKSSETSSPYKKFAGLTLAVIGVDQAEEVPRDVYEHLKARASQPGVPHQILLTPNPPGPDHWLVDEFPETNSKLGIGHRYIHTTVYDNAEHVGQQYIDGLEREYPPGHPLRRRFIEGRRGLSVVGEPIYGKIFHRDMHVAPVEYNPELPILEAWDFGHGHPAVLWAQTSVTGQRLYFGHLMGTSQFLEEFGPLAQQIRAQLFPDVSQVLSCCDPAGADKSNQGLRRTAVEVLTELGISPRWVPGSNHLERRSYAIQQIAGHMLRMTSAGPGLVAHPRCNVLIDGFEQGYVKDEQARAITLAPSLIIPKKDGYYDHLQNCAEYIELNFGTAHMTQQDIEKAERRRQERLQKDVDPYDRLRRQPRVGRGGY